MTATPEEQTPPGFPRPVGFPETVAVAWRLYRDRFGRFFLPALALYIVSLQLSTIAGLPIEDPSGGLYVALVVFAVFVGGIVPHVLTTLLFATLSITYRDALLGEDRSLRDSNRTLGSRRREVILLGLAAASFLVAVSILFQGFSVFLRPLLLGPPILVQIIALEGKPFREVNVRTRELASGYWSKVLLCLVCVGAGITIVESVLLSLGFQLSLTQMSQEGALAVVYWSAPLLRALTEPFLAAIGFVVYNDLRARKEEITLETVREESVV